MKVYVVPDFNGAAEEALDRAFQEAARLSADYPGQYDKVLVQSENEGGSARVSATAPVLRGVIHDSPPAPTGWNRYERRTDEEMAKPQARQNSSEVRQNRA